jgi:diguanylate cyclase (GGDEF)-like protein
VINDTYGRHTGDCILRELAVLDLASVRESELLARYGGEECALILPNTALAQAQSPAVRLWPKVQEHCFIHHEEVIPITTISLGVASTGTREVTRQEVLMHTADAALYRTKEAGRSRYIVAYGNQAFRCARNH